MTHRHTHSPDRVHCQFFEGADVGPHASEAHKRFIEVIREAGGAQLGGVVRADDHRVTL